MTYNLGINEKIGNFKIDLAKTNSPTVLEFTNDATDQIYIYMKNANTMVITAFAMKADKTTSKYIYAKVENYYHENKFIGAPATHDVTWLQYQYIGMMGLEYDWTSVGINSALKDIDIGTEIRESEVGTSNITFYFGDKNGRNLKEIYKKEFPAEPLYAWGEPETITGYNEVTLLCDSGTIEKYAPDFSQYQAGTATIDYKRAYGTWTITNLNAYNGSNGVYVTDQNNGHSNFNVMEGSMDIGDSTSTKSQNLQGYFTNDTINGGRGADKITTGGGTDTINPGKGNDAVNITGTGIKNISIGQGDGKDTISGAEKATNVNLTFDTPNIYYNYKGNDLVISRAYSTTNIEETVIKNFKKNKPTNVSVNGEQIRDGNFELTYLPAKGAMNGTNESNTMFGGVNTSVINAKNGDNYIDYLEERTQNAKAQAGTGNDTFVLRNPNTTIEVTDKGGNSDRLVVWNENYAKNNFFFYYDINVNKSGVITTDTTMHLINTNNVAAGITAHNAKKMTDTATIKNFQTKTGGQGAGYIETIGVNEETYNVNFASLNQQVAGWLADRGYSSTSQAFKKADDVQSLINIYIANSQA